MVDFLAIKAEAVHRPDSRLCEKKSANALEVVSKENLGLKIICSSTEYLLDDHIRSSSNPFLHHGHWMLVPTWVLECMCCHVTQQRLPAIELSMRTCIRLFSFMNMRRQSIQYREP
jgi:hypothetical protein